MPPPRSLLPLSRRKLPPILSTGLVGALAVAGCLLLTGYVVPPTKVLEEWIASRMHSRTRGAVEVPVRWGESKGTLYAAGPGRNALALEGQPAVFDSGPAAGGSWNAFWRAVDLFWASTAEELAASLQEAGVDLGRGGYARSQGSRDGVAHTLGSRGEGEGTLPQVWTGRIPLWPNKVFLPDSEEVTIGPPGLGGWPVWFRLKEKGLIEVSGPPSPSPGSPAWARPVRDPGAPAGDPLPDWRRLLDKVAQ